MDQVVYINQIMGLTDEGVQTYLPKKCINVREEVQGTVQTVRKCFLNYGPDDTDDPNDGLEFADYQYARTANFLALPAPPYIPAGVSEDGWFEYLGLWSEADPTTGTPDLFYIVQGPIMANVFGVDLGFQDGNIGGFTQAADDAREVIEFTHDRPLPLGYDTPVPLSCIPSTDAIYDVSISGDSGLQVPIRMKVNATDREFSVTVANAGDPATGTVSVVGKDSAGKEVFNRDFTFTGVTEGLPQTFPWTFTIDYATTITWTATAATDCATCDLNQDNNSVTETTIVQRTGGGRT